MKPYFKSDLGTSLFILICSIVIPPLFVINLIILTIQLIIKAIIAYKDNKENKYESQE